MVKGRALARPSERSERFEPLVRHQLQNVEFPMFVHVVPSDPKVVFPIRLTDVPSELYSVFPIWLEDVPSE